MLTEEKLIERKAIKESLIKIIILDKSDLVLFNLD
tara:strand:- start:45 stop:149 length:105 start_codon:yes stop_codon:yes gene_type:complete